MVHLTGTAKNCLVQREKRVKRPRGLFQGTHLKLDDPFLGKAQVHALRVLQVEGTLVELGDGIVGVQQRRLLVHLADDLHGNESGEEMSDGSEERRRLSSFPWCVEALPVWAGPFP